MKPDEAALVQMILDQNTHLRPRLAWGERRTLPARRASEVVKFAHHFDMGENDRIYYLTVGFYRDWTPGETFINAKKASSPQEAIAKDAAILLSVALQYGAPLTIIQEAMTRGLDGKHPLSPIGGMCDQLVMVSQEQEKLRGKANYYGTAAEIPEDIYEGHRRKRAAGNGSGGGEGSS